MNAVKVLQAVLLAAAVVACTSPEGSRQRSGGPGADQGNRSQVVNMHEGARPYWRTPERLADGVGASTEAAYQADRLSRGQRAALSPR
jgi:hypothetical protein